MWVEFDKIEFQDNLRSRSGSEYSAWVATGTKQAYKDVPAAPWRKVFFENQATTVVERGMPRPGCSIVQFLKKGVSKGDILVIKSERDGPTFWRIVSMENKSRNMPSYEPLPEESKPAVLQSIPAPSFLPKEEYTDSMSEVPF